MHRCLLAKPSLIWQVQGPTNQVFLQELSQRTLGVLQRQTRNFKLILTRRALHAFAANLSLQYNSIYATLLGADSTRLGSLHSVGNAIGALAAVPAGWFIDNYAPKRVFLLGTSLLAASSLLYFIAPDWIWLYPTIILYYLGMRITCTSCTVICAAELPNEDRATGRGLCQTLTSIIAIVTPLLAALIISRSGGLELQGIKPLYLIQGLIFVGIFGLLFTRLRADYRGRTSSEKSPILSGFTKIFKQGPDVVRLMLVVSLMELPWMVAQPFMPVFAFQIKNANEFVLGGIAMAINIVPLLASIPLGRIADRYGRKKLLFAIAPLAYVGNLCLIFAPREGMISSVMLFLYGLLFGFNVIGMTLASSMAAEIMPKELMGRWIGIVGLFRGLMSIPAPLIGGLIWKYIGPEYVFIAAIAIDVFIRLPLLSAVRETLHLNSTIR